MHPLRNQEMMKGKRVNSPYRPYSQVIPLNIVPNWKVHSILAARIIPHLFSNNSLLHSLQPISPKRSCITNVSSYLFDFKMSINEGSLLMCTLYVASGKITVLDSSGQYIFRSLPASEIPRGSRNSQSCDANFAQLDRLRESTRIFSRENTYTTRGVTCPHDDWVPYLKIT